MICFSLAQAVCCWEVQNQKTTPNRTNMLLFWKTAVPIHYSLFNGSSFTFDSFIPCQQFCRSLLACLKRSIDGANHLQCLSILIALHRLNFNVGWFYIEEQQQTSKWPKVIFGVISPRLNGKYDTHWFDKLILSNGSAILILWNFTLGLRLDFCQNSTPGDRWGECLKGEGLIEAGKEWQKWDSICYHPDSEWVA